MDSNSCKSVILCRTSYYWSAKKRLNRLIHQSVTTDEDIVLIWKCRRVINTKSRPRFRNLKIKKQKEINHLLNFFHRTYYNATPTSPIKPISRLHITSHYNHRLRHSSTIHLRELHNPSRPNIFMPIITLHFSLSRVPFSSHNFWHKTCKHKVEYY